MDGFDEWLTDETRYGSLTRQERIDGDEQQD